MFDIAKDFFLNEAAEEKERCGISTRNLGYISCVVQAHLPFLHGSVQLTSVF